MPSWNIYPIVLIAVLAVFMAMPLYIWLGSKRLQGRDAPDYAALLAPEQQGRDKLLFYFYSAHCGPCRSLAPLIDAMAARHGNVVKVDSNMNAPYYQAIDTMEKAGVDRQYIDGWVCGFLHNPRRGLTARHRSLRGRL